MNNKGFLSTSIVYSFFLVFLMLLLFIVNELISDRILMNRLTDEVKEDLAEDNIARYLILNYETLGLVRHDQSLTNGSLDNSYRFVGANPDNYICIGSADATCPEDNLYRIIGVIDGKVKVVKNTSIGAMPIDENGLTNFGDTTIYFYLNGEFLNTLGDWQEKIANVTWYVDGLNEDIATSNVFDIYLNEVGAEKINETFVINKVGLLYISDYGYATDVENYTNAINGTNNWLNNNQNTWFITKDITDLENINYYYLDDSGNISRELGTVSYEIRPVFYLNSSTKLADGDGTITNPYRIEV